LIFQIRSTCLREAATAKAGEIRNSKRFDKPFDRPTVLSRFEGLTALSDLEGQYRMTKTQMDQTIWRIFPTRNDRKGKLFLSLEHSGFGFVSDFDIRISALTMILPCTA
jgi:hypothetical protein